MTHPTGFLPRGAQGIGAGRPQQNLAGTRDFEALDDAMLLALLLSPDCCGVESLQVAQRLLRAVGGAHRLCRSSVADLMRVAGVGPVRARRICAGLQLGRRLLLRESEPQPADESILVTYESVVRWARPRLVPLRHEEVWLLCLDARLALRSARRVSQGGRHGCAVLPADILRPAVADLASAIVLVHNHPSGDPTPSHADYSMTSSLDRACELVGLQLLDHIVVASSGSRSLKAESQRTEGERVRRCPPSSVRPPDYSSAVR